MKIAMIGAGNVATHLALALKNSGNQILEIYSRSKASAKELADKLAVKYTTDIETINNQVDLFVISISDNAVLEVLEKLKPAEIFTVHTSGSISMEIFKDFASNFGVFYPLQTFSKTKEIDFEQVPFCIEANSPDNEKKLINLAKLLSKKVYLINSEQRKYIHIAAVFGCNFVNHMYAIAQKILDRQQIPFEILHSLIFETAEKALKNNPKDVQTGPALRADKNIINLQKDLLSGYPIFHEIYSLLSQSIQQMKNE